jgi:hypothetical protein
VNEDELESRNEDDAQPDHDGGVRLPCGALQNGQQQRKRECVKDDFHDVPDGRVKQPRLGTWNVDVFGKARDEEISADRPHAKSVATAAETPTPRTHLDVTISNQPREWRKARDTNPTRAVMAIASSGGILPK